MILKRGDTGPDVEALQLAIGADVDGRFGPQTEGKLYAFQKALGLTQDGIADPEVQAAIAAIKAGKHVTEPATERTYGIDMYREDVVFSFDKVFQSGRRFNSIQITQGSNPHLIHPTYRKVADKSRAAGLITGPYHFVRFEQDIKAQATFFCDQVERLDPLRDTDLMPMYDWEYLSGHDVKKGDLEKCLIFGDIVKERLKRRMIIYSGYFTVEEACENEPDLVKELSQYSFWLAWYARESVVKTPRPWGHWHIWQYLEAPTPGVSGNFDLDVFNGSLDDLKALVKASVIP